MQLPRSVRAIARRARSRFGGTPAPASRPTTPAVPHLPPAPDLAPFPDALYVYAVNAIPRDYGGRSASIVAKARIFAEQAGVESVLLTFRHSSELADIEHDMREKGTIGEGFRFVCLHDYYPDDTEYDGPAVDHPLDEDGFVWVKDPDYRIYRFFDREGVYRFYKRYDYAGRLIVRDFFNPNRGRTLREEFRLNGTLRRRIYMDLHYNLPRQEIHYRADQTPAFTIWWVIDPDSLVRSVERVTVFGADGSISEALESLDPINYLCLDRLIGERKAFLMVEERLLDRPLLNYPNPNATTVHVLHASHIKEPYNDVMAVRPIFRALFEMRDRTPAIVFLTATQRHEAEQKYGSSKAFQVIPHAVAPATDHQVERDPNLVIMMARLDENKRVDHAIRAFAKAAQKLPKARLEVYGRGLLKPQLLDLISDLNLTGRVELMGFTKQPALAYQRASVSLLTSGFEGMGLVIPEAMSHGCPVISYDIRYGPADVITDGVDGFLVPPGDRSAMADRIVQLLTDAEGRERMSRAARRRAADFSETAFAARWSALFNELDARG